MSVVRLSIFSHSSLVVRATAPCSRLRKSILSSNAKCFFIISLSLNDGILFRIFVSNSVS